MAVRQESPQVSEWAGQFADLVRGLGEARHGVSGLQPVDGFLRALLGVAASSVVDTSHDGVSVVAAISPELAALEQVLGESGASPALAAGRANAAVACADVASSSDLETAYAEAMVALGIHAVAVLPLVARGDSFGALCLYSESVRTWSEEDLAVAGLVADLVASHLQHAAQLDGQRLLAGQLQTALNSRVVIEQAKGVLAASENIDVDTAFERMRREARRSNTKLATVAAAVIAGAASSSLTVSEGS